MRAIRLGRPASSMARQGGPVEVRCAGHFKRTLAPWEGAASIAADLAYQQPKQADRH
jgi:hypothetical protein